MRTKALLAGGIATAALIVTLTACSSGSSTGSPSSSSSNPTTGTPASSGVALSGTFDGLNGKKVSGSVSIEGGTVTLSGFSSDEGPDLHLWLADGTTEADVDAGTEISKVAYDRASQTVTLSGGVDASRFTDLVVHCDKAKAVFGAAALSK